MTSTSIDTLSKLRDLGVDTDSVGYILKGSGITSSMVLINTRISLNSPETQEMLTSTGEKYKAYIFTLWQFLGEDKTLLLLNKLLSIYKDVRGNNLKLPPEQEKDIDTSTAEYHIMDYVFRGNLKSICDKLNGR